MTQRTGLSGPVVSEQVDVTINFASCAASTALDQTFAVAGAEVGDSIIVTPLGTWPDGLGIPVGRCVVTGQVIFRISNPTAGAIDPASQAVRLHLEHQA